jgi:hypothetical protein
MGPKQMKDVALTPAEVSARAAGARISMAPRDRLSKTSRRMRDNATKGSPPMTHPEFSCGFRRME